MSARPSDLRESILAWIDGELAAAYAAAHLAPNGPEVLRALRGEVERHAPLDEKNFHRKGWLCAACRAGVNAHELYPCPTLVRIAAGLGLETV